MDRRLAASSAMPLIQRHVQRGVPIFVHPHDVNKPVAMQPVAIQRALETAGFNVTMR